ncbi:hypothetical protein NL676_027854 [Syzygium grande]|nr:hypothetical protein NL676_027854 [Syzygium grande]
MKIVHRRLFPETAYDSSKRRRWVVQAEMLLSPSPPHTGRHRGLCLWMVAVVWRRQTGGTAAPAIWSSGQQQL